MALADLVHRRDQRRQFVDLQILHFVDGDQDHAALGFCSLGGRNQKVRHVVFDIVAVGEALWSFHLHIGIADLDLELGGKGLQRARRALDQIHGFFGGTELYVQLAQRWHQELSQALVLGRFQVGGQHATLFGEARHLPQQYGFADAAQAVIDLAANGPAVHALDDGRFGVLKHHLAAEQLTWLGPRARLKRVFGFSHGEV